MAFSQAISGLKVLVLPLIKDVPDTNLGAPP